MTYKNYDDLQVYERTKLALDILSAAKAFEELANTLMDCYGKDHSIEALDTLLREEKEKAIAMSNRLESMIRIKMEVV